MKVLFLLSCLEPAGSETYCVSLAKAWQACLPDRQGRHEIFWISDRLHFGQAYTSYPIHQKIFPGGLLNTLRVLRYVRENRIELIHSHSRRANWVASHVSALTKIPHVTTIHQPPPVHMFSRMSPCLGDHTLAIDEAVMDHLQTYFRRGLRKASLIRNGVEIGPAAPSPASDPRILYLGRLTGGRWRALQFFFSVLKRSGGSLPKTCYQVVGRIPEERVREMASLISEVNRLIKPSFVETHDFVTNLAPLIAGSQGVIGGGRSALESLAAGKPVIALGERGVVGLCDSTTWTDAMRTNFGDHFATRSDEFYPAKLEIGLRQLLGNPQEAAALGLWGRDQVRQHYDVKTVAEQIDTVYREMV